MFEMDGEYKSALDYSKLNNSKVSALMQMEVFLIDECPMTDSDCFSSIEELLSIVDHNKRPDATAADSFGALHVILFGDGCVIRCYYY